MQEVGVQRIFPRGFKSYFSWSLWCARISSTLTAGMNKWRMVPGNLEEGLGKVTKTVFCLQRDLNTALVVSVRCSGKDYSGVWWCWWPVGGAGSWLFCVIYFMAMGQLSFLCDIFNLRRNCEHFCISGCYLKKKNHISTFGNFQSYWDHMNLSKPWTQTMGLTPFIRKLELISSHPFLVFSKSRRYFLDKVPEL